MTALANGRDPKETGAYLFNDPVKGSVHIYVGAAVGVDSAGYLRPMVKAVALKARGVATQEKNNTGSDGDLRCDSKAGVYLFHIDATHPVTRAHIEQLVYFEDDQTVAANATGSRNPAGRLVDIKDWHGTDMAAVAVGHVFAPDGDLVAANNLSDVAAPATARANIGANVGHLQMVIDTLVGTGVTRIPLPDRALTITKIKSTLQGALATGDATLTFSINAAAITGGVITITQSGSAAGDLDEVNPSAANVSDAADDELRCTVGGTNTNAVKALVTIEYTY